MFDFFGLGDLIEKLGEDVEEHIRMRRWGAVIFLAFVVLAIFGFLVWLTILSEGH